MEEQTLSPEAQAMAERMRTVPETRTARVIIEDGFQSVRLVFTRHGGVQPGDYDKWSWSWESCRDYKNDPEGFEMTDGLRDDLDLPDHLVAALENLFWRGSEPGYAEAERFHGEMERARAEHVAREEAR